MSHLSFWAGLAVGWLTAIAAGCALWYGMLRYLRGMDPADLQPGGTRTVIHVGEPDPPDPLPLPDRYAGETCACGHGRPAHRGTVGEGDPLTHCRAPECLCEGWMNAERWDLLDTRGPTTHYPPHSTHHDLTPDTDGDGTTIYRRTR